MRSPCKNRTELFEPYLRKGETLGQRGQRIEVALSICDTCPSRLKKACSEASKEAILPRGVWGGKVVTSSELER